MNKRIQIALIPTDDIAWPREVLTRVQFDTGLDDRFVTKARKKN